MKRFEIQTRSLLVFCMALGIPSMLVGCGGEERSASKDAGSADGGGSSDGKTDLLRLDSSPVAVDTSGDQAVTATDGAPSQLDSNADLLISTDTGLTADDASPDEAVVTDPDALASPDAPILADDSGPGEDSDQTPDLPLGSDAPLAEDLPVAPIDGGSSDIPFIALDGALALDSTIDSVGTPGIITGWPTDPVDFGASPCGGGAPAAKTFTLVNSGGTPVSITSAQFTGTAGYSTDAAGKTIPAGGSLIVTIQAPGIPQTSAVPAVYVDVLTIQTDLPNDDQHLISVTESAQGAVVAWNTSQGFGSFGSLAPGHTSSASFQVRNTGNLPVAINLNANGAFAVTSTLPMTIPAGNSADATVAFTAPSSGGSAAGALWMVLANQVALCHALPDPLGLTGTSINGAIALSAVSLSFATACGSAPVGKTFTVTNTGAAPMQWSAALEASSNSVFQLSSFGATLTPSSSDPEPSTVVTVTPASPANATPVTDTIDVTEVVCGGEVLTGGGIIGRVGSFLRAAGRVQAKFVENAWVMSPRALEIEASVLNSHLQTHDKLVMGPRGVVVGSKVEAQNGIEVFQVGNPQGSRSQIICGMDYLVIEKLEWVRTQSLLLVKQLRALENHRLAHPDKESELVRACAKVRNQILKLNEMSRTLVSRIDKNEEAAVLVRGTAFPGTSIEICHVVTVLTRLRTRVRFVLDKVRGAIREEAL